MAELILPLGRGGSGPCGGEGRASWARRPGAAPEPGLLSGLAVSPGVARRRVRRVRDAGSGARLDPGGVLVAPFTDPAWTPLFLSAAAVVVEVGSLLSHASIVARELGLPCVVEVAGALDRLRDGELVEVDGSRGTIRRLDG
jgi:pyruvate,water dikinase